MVPINGIIEFHGAIVNIPTNYALCDGNNGTPDLTDKFIIGAGGVLPPGTTGGAAEHTHLLNIDDHAHEPLATHQCPGSGGIGAASATISQVFTDEAEVTGSTDDQGNLPPYYALAKIMRIS